MDPFMLKTQLERNNADLEQYSRDISEWSNEMKKKEGGLHGKKKPKKAAKKVHSNEEQEVKPSKKVPCRGGGDYAVWEKYDADKECEKIDKETSISVADYDEVSDETDDENIEESGREKDKGNDFFKANDFKNAIKCYTKAIDLYAYNPIYFANRAMCYLKLEDYEKADSDCSLALQLDKKYVKAYQRRAIARENLNKLAEARKDILKVFDFEPSNKESKAVLKRIETKMKKTQISKSSLKIDTPKIETTASKVQATDTDAFARPKSKFALSRQQNKEIKTTYSPPNLIDPISDKIIERKTVSNEINNLNDKLNLTDKKECSFKWPTHDDEIKEYRAIKKPPKIRSQSTLKKIEVTEKINEHSIMPLIKDDAVNIDNTNKNTNKPNEIVTPQISQISNIPAKSDDLDKIIFERVPMDDFTLLINRPVPKTALQFHYNWNELNSELKYLFLLQIHPTEFVSIFKDSLESDTFSAVLKVMAEEFIPRNKTVVPHLYGLSKVKRFSTLVMFKTPTDTSALKMLMDHIQQDKEFSNFFDLLKKRYEMV